MSSSHPGPTRWRVVIGGTALVLSALLVLTLDAAHLSVLWSWNLNDLGKLCFGTRVLLDGGSAYETSPGSLVPVGPGVADRLLNLNAPHLALLLAPLARLQPIGILMAWIGMSLAGALVSIGLVDRESSLLRSHRTVLAPAAVCLMGSGALLSLLATGQVTLLLMPALVLAWLWVRRGRWVQGATALGLAASFKPFLLVFAPFVFVRGGLRGGLCFSAAFAAPFALGLLVLGPEPYQEWGATLSAVDWQDLHMNGSLLAVLERGLATTITYTPLAHHPGWVGPVWAVSAGAVVLASVWVSATGNLDRAFTVLVLGAILASPLGWAYYGLWALPSLLVFLTTTPTPPGWWRYGRAALLWGALAGAMSYAVHMAWPGEHGRFATLTVGSTVFWAHLLSWLAVVIDGLVHAHSAQPSRGAPRPLGLWAVGSAGCLGLALVGAPAASHWAGRDVVPPTDETVVFAVLDGVRASATSPCGAVPANTPTLHELTEHGATWSCDVLPSGSWVLPATASLFTSLGVEVHEVEDCPLDRSRVVIAEALRSRGYQTVGISGDPLVGPLSALDRGFDVFATAPARGGFAGGAMRKELRRVLATQVRRDGTPLFLYLGLSEASGPWPAVPPGLDYAAPSPAVDSWTTLGVADESQVPDVYAFGVRRADDSLRWALDELEVRGWLEGGYRIVVVGSHGVHLGEHGHTGPCHADEVRVLALVHTSPPRGQPETLGATSLPEVAELVVGGALHLDLPQTREQVRARSPTPAADCDPLRVELERLGYVERCPP